MLEDIEKVKDQVAYCLEHYPDTRDNDKLLTLGIYALFYGLKKSLGQDAYNKFREWLLSNEVPANESITRCRRKFQEDGKWRGEKYELRQDEEGVIREYYRD